VPVNSCFHADSEYALFGSIVRKGAEFTGNKYIHIKRHSALYFSTDIIAPAVGTKLSKWVFKKPRFLGLKTKNLKKSEFFFRF